MRYHITASNTHPCIIQLPASKSISNRALIINALAGSPYPAINIAQCNDTKVIIDALASNSSVIDIDAAGTAMRFLTAYYSMQEGRNVTITGSQR
ncbi:MAG: 3-phosphoshikimate 1-carboxyvinyltransferase, partial [Bacteroidaceae bacterium]|nr:3-phosphoshikimate 1-carboxyvinyltransferase [Bacteroidaceae bacterium]